MGCPTEVELSENLTFSVCTHDPDTGVLTDADAVPTYRVYEDGTEAAILNGNMDDGSGAADQFDDANTTGFYVKTIACTTANGFETGKSYTIYIEATVDGDKGGICYGFKCSSRLTTLATYIDTEVAAILADTNELQGDWVNGGRLDVILDAILEDTGTTIPGTITTIDNEIAVIDGIVDAIKLKTDNLPSSIPKAVALLDFAFVMYSSTDHVTPSTGLSVSGYISKDGGAFAALGGTIAAIASGVYQVDEISAVETDADIIVLRFTAAGADDVVIVIKTDS